VFDHSLFLYGAGISDSNLHYHYDLPTLVVAGQEFGITGGRHLAYGDTPLANLQLALVERMGIPLEQFGDSTGRLDVLTGV
jgi:hypothetical protein